MATTNLVRKTLGSVEIQSGNGIPDHVSPKGSIYTNLDTNLLWLNDTGLDSGWTMVLPSMYGELNLDTNTTLTTPSGIGTYVSLSGLTWVNNNNNLKGFTVSGNKLVLNSGCTGTYRIIGNLGVLRNATANDYIVGVSINGSIPSYSFQSGLGTTTIKTAGQGVVIIDTVLNGGDTIELTVAPTISGSGTFYVRNGTLIIYRIYS